MLQAAVEKARRMADSPEIVLQGGTYYMEKPVVLTPEIRVQSKIH
ncbi:MAG TPA: hypothetical protein VK112_05615 [Fodinibius sp.]|nr:hypothetical protein [Fodinibius sp.]